MVTLYESIIANTNIGIKKHIEDWLSKNLVGPNVFDNKMQKFVKCYTINSKNEIDSVDNFNIIIKSNIKDVPSYIKFGNIYGFSINGDFVKLAKPEQYPHTANYITINAADKIKTFKCDVKDFIRIFNNYSIKSFEDIYINFTGEGKFGRSDIEITNTNIDIDMFKHIHATNCYNIDMINSDAAKEIMKNIKKLDKKGIGIDDYLNDVFSNIKGLRFVKLGKRTNLELSRQTNKWIVW